jgi:hypothetical protein
MPRAGLAQHVARILRRPALILSGEVTEVELGGALVYGGQKARQDHSDPVLLANGRTFLAPGEGAYVPVIFECPDGRRFYARYTAAGFQQFEVVLERVPLVELDDEDAARLRRDEGISQLVTKLRGAPQSHPPKGEPTAVGQGGVPPEIRQAARSAAAGGDGSGVEAGKPALTPGARVVAAAYELQKEGKPISLRAACDRARVDRANLRKNYPEAVEAVRRMMAPDRTPRRGVRNRRTGDIDALDDSED